MEPVRPGQDGHALRFSPDWVAKHRAKLELSAADYAELVGVSAITIYNWESGKTRPRPKQLEALAEVRKMGKREAGRSWGTDVALPVLEQLTQGGRGATQN